MSEIALRKSPDPRQAYPAVLARLDKVLAPNRHGTCKACCPAHDDSHQSLIAWVGDNGKLVLRCLAGCEPRDIVSALGITFKELAPDASGRAIPTRVRPKEVKRYDYCDEYGEVCHQTVRMQPKDFRQCRTHADGRTVWSLQGGWYRPAGSGELVGCRKGDPLAVWVPPARMQLYRLCEMLAWPGRAVFWVEGEKDADRLADLGFLSTTTACGSKAPWQKTYNRHVKGRDFFVIPDNDPAGYQYAGVVLGRLVMHGARSAALLQLPGLPPGGDLSDWLAALDPTEDAAAALRLLAGAASRVRRV